MDRVSSQARRGIRRCRRVDIRLSEVISALSYALDVTEGQPIGHAVRSCAIGMRIGEEIGLDDDERSSLFYALVLKDAGCSSNAAKLSPPTAAAPGSTRRWSTRCAPRAATARSGARWAATSRTP